MKFILIEGTDYEKNAAKVISDSGLFDEQTSLNIINSLKNEDIHAFVHSPNWLRKYLKGIARMLVEESNGDKDRAVQFLTDSINFFDQFLTWVKENRNEQNATKLDNDFINNWSFA